VKITQMAVTWNQTEEKINKI